MDISVLDLLTMTDQDTSETVFNNTIDLAKKLDHWGYKRIWFAEHHNSQKNISSAPEISAAFIAGLTKQIRVGTGGTMVMHYSPLKLAEQFKTLASYAPDRVDFGLGRAPGGDYYEIMALSQGNHVPKDDQYSKIERILDYLRDKAPAGKLYSRVEAQPRNIQKLPQPWLLGSTGNSAKKAAELGLGYSFAKFFGVISDPEIFQSYYNNFKPSPFFEEPNIIATYEIIVADTEEEADYLAKPLEIQSLKLNKQSQNFMMSPEKARDFKLDNYDHKELKRSYDNRFLIKGTPEKVAEIITNEQKELGFDELMVYSPIYHHKDRLKSYKSLYDILH